MEIDFCHQVFLSFPNFVVLFWLLQSRFLSTFEGILNASKDPVNYASVFQEFSYFNTLYDITYNRD